MPSITEILLVNGLKEFSLLESGPKKLLTEDSEGNTRLALFLLEDAAIRVRDIGALAMAIRVLLRSRGEAIAVYDAIDLLEKFYGRTNERAGPNGRTMHNMSMLLGNEKHVRTVAILFEEILKAPKFYENTRRCQLFFVVLMCYVGHGAHGDANFDILRSLVFKFCSDEVAEAVALIVSTFSADQSDHTDQPISDSAFLCLGVWVGEAIRIIAKEVDGAMAFKELGVNPQRAIGPTSGDLTLTRSSQSNPASDLPTRRFS